MMKAQTGAARLSTSGACHSHAAMREEVMRVAF
jgi:hypothetical protein